MMIALCLVAGCKSKDAPSQGGAGSASGATPAGESAPAGGPVTLNGSGSTLPEAVPGGRDRGLREGQPEHQGQLRRRRLGQGPPGLRRHGDRLRRAPTRRTRTPTWRSSRAASSSTCPCCSARSPSATTSTASTSSSSRPRRSRRSSSARSRSGTTRRSPPTTPGAKLPAADIVVAHRSDGSGTTEQFTKYLDLAAGGAWKLKSGSTVEWPADTQAGNGNGGVAQIVKTTKGAIGYVDLPDAKASGLKYANVKNQAGKFVEPSAASASAAGDGIDGQGQPDVRSRSTPRATRPIRSPRRRGAWSTRSTTDKAKAEALKAYFKFMVTDGQKLIPEIDFAPLSKTLQDKARRRSRQDPGDDARPPRQARAR